MPDVVKVKRSPGLARDRWLATYEDGTPLFEIRLQVSSMLNGSRFFVLTPEGDLVGDGEFDFGVWNEDARREVLSAIVRSRLAGTRVDFAETA